MSDQDLRNRRFLAGDLEWTGLARVVRPTLIVALGGTGATAAKAARARIESFAGARHHFIAFRALDTAYQDNREPRFVDSAEFVYLGGFNAQAVIADILTGDAFPHWGQWLPPRLNFQQVAFGAGGIRPIGRLCYFYRRDLVEAAVREALTTITDANEALHLHQQNGIRVNLEAGIDIHVVCSVCGGTGAGMFLDVAYDLRRWAEDHTDREVTVTGHLVLPEAFRRKPVVLKALEANAYIALQELDRYMNATPADPWIIEHIQGRPEISRRAPFDHCYLLSGLQQGGTNDIESLTAVIGEVITLLTLSQVGQTVSAGVINMAGQRKSTRDNRGRLCCYSSYGVLGLEIPWGLLGESLGPELAERVHKRLAARDVRRDEDLEPEIQRFREAMNLDVRLPEHLVPIPKLDKAPIGDLVDTLGKRSAQPGGELQRQLTQVRESVLRELQHAEERDLWSPVQLRTYLRQNLRESLLAGHGGGLDAAMRWLAGCANALEIFKRQLRASGEEADEKAEKGKLAAETLEKDNLAGRDWEKQVWPEVTRWEGHVQEDARAQIFKTQARKIDALAVLIRQEMLEPWRKIQVLFEDLRLDPPRGEESYYRSRPAMTSVCPIAHFADIIEPVKERLIRSVLEDLVMESDRWADFSRRDLTERLNGLCVEAMQDHFEKESGIECDRLLAEYYGHPSEKYETELNVLLGQAQANWELQESYSLRTNKLEISAVGAHEDSLLYSTIARHHHHISSVDEQRRDYVPIFRTEHGISMVGLKRLDAYRESLVNSIVHEQRYDFHFFLDARWITRMEFADEKPEELRRLYLFSVSDLLGLIERQENVGYLLPGNPNEVLGRYRRAAYLRFRDDEDLQHRLEQEMSKQDQRPGWTARLEEHVEKLQRRIQEKVVPEKKRNAAVAPPRFLSLDVYQLHSEIRALLGELRVEDLGI